MSSTPHTQGACGYAFYSVLVKEGSGISFKLFLRSADVSFPAGRVSLKLRKARLEICKTNDVEDVRSHDQRNFILGGDQAWDVSFPDLLADYVSLESASLFTEKVVADGYDVEYDNLHLIAMICPNLREPPV